LEFTYIKPPIAAPKSTAPAAIGFMTVYSSKWGKICVPNGNRNNSIVIFQEPVYVIDAVLCINASCTARSLPAMEKEVVSAEGITAGCPIHSRFLRMSGRDTVCSPNFCTGRGFASSGHS
jgi:hypothetical protein